MGQYSPLMFKEESLEEFHAWASRASRNLSGPSKRYIAAFLAAEDQLPSWLSQCTFCYFVESEDIGEFSPLEIAAADLFREGISASTGDESDVDGSRSGSIFRVMQQEKHILDGAETLREFLNRAGVLLMLGVRPNNIREKILNKS